MTNGMTRNENTTSGWTLLSFVSQESAVYDLGKTRKAMAAESGRRAGKS